MVVLVLVEFALRGLLALQALALNLLVLLVELVQLYQTDAGELSRVYRDRSCPLHFENTACAQLSESVNRFLRKFRRVRY